MAFKRFLKCSLPNQDKISPQKFHLPVEIFQLINDVNLGKNEFDWWNLKYLRNSREKQHWK